MKRKMQAEIVDMVTNKIDDSTSQSEHQDEKSFLEYPFINNNIVVDKLSHIFEGNHSNYAWQLTTNKHVKSAYLAVRTKINGSLPVILPWSRYLGQSENKIVNGFNPLCYPPVYFGYDLLSVIQKANWPGTDEIMVFQVPLSMCGSDIGLLCNPTGTDFRIADLCCALRNRPWYYTGGDEKQVIKIVENAKDAERTITNWQRDENQIPPGDFLWRLRHTNFNQAISFLNHHCFNSAREVLITSEKFEYLCQSRISRCVIDTSNKTSYWKIEDDIIKAHALHHEKQRDRLCDKLKNIDANSFKISCI